MATYTDELRRAVHIAQKHCKEYSSELFTPAHLLMGLLHNDVGLASWLAVQGKDIHYLRDWAEIRMEESPRTGRTPENPPGNAQVKATMELADLIALQLGRDPTDPLSVLGALLKPGVGFSAEQLRSFPLTQKELLDAALDDTATQEALQGPAPGPDGKAAGDSPAPKSAGALLKFCHDKTALAAEGRMDPIIGRDREIRMMVEVLSRRTKPNVILVGEPGVGKTALVDGFALNIVAGKVPSNLLGARLFELDTGALAAGASYKGEVEDRVKNILRELKQFEKAILFIDEIHVLLDSRGALGGGIVNLLKPELARGELTVIGATTNDEYRKYIETDEAFGRRFEVLNVPEPDVTTAIRMLKHLLPLYEKHHQLRIEDDVLSEAVRLSKRYVKDRRLPDVAVDLLDRTLAATRLMRETSAPEVEALRLRLEAVLAETPPDLLLPELRWFDTELRHRISPLLLSQLEDTDWVANDIDVADVLRQHLEQTLTDLARCAQLPKEAVTKHDIAAVISHKTGIPLGKIQSKERDKLLLVEEVLRQRVIGQNHAVKALSDSILESRAGLTKAGQPVGSFFLLGSTGTGKTELAKALADFLFNDEAFLIRFDMSEFKEEHSAALLYGAPPGYVGYEEGGLLVNKIREKPYSVVLFDEIEKAHPSVFDIFLQILDEGRLHDRLGKEGDFSNAVVLFTSNIGSEFISQEFGAGRVPANTDLMEAMARHFRPEFLARLTEIVPFAPISEENAVLIFTLHLRGLTDLLSKQGITLDVLPEARRHLALSGFTPKYGARQLKGVIRNELRRPISRMIVGGKLPPGSTVTVGVEAGALTWAVEVPPVAEGVLS